MRNLKRALSLALASVMLLGMMVVGTSAASYKDVDSKDNLESIEVLKMVGIMTGDDKGNFNPDKMVTRNEMAVVMCNLLGLKTGGTHPFTDVPAWAAPYVAACYNNGIIAGVSATQFNGDANVTAVQAGLMLMKALGYFGYAGEFGDSWKLSVVKQADKINLYDGINAYTDQDMTRNEVAKMVLNALESTIQVVTEEGGVQVNGNGVSVNVKATYKYEDAKNSSGKGYNGINDGVMQLCEKLFGNDLKKGTADNYVDDFGRPATQWTYKEDDITSAKEPEMTYVKDFDKDELKDLKDDKYDFTGAKVYVNGVEDKALDADKVAARDYVGTTIELYTADNNSKKVTHIVLVQGYLAQVTNVDEDSIDLDIYNPWTKNSLGCTVASNLYKDDTKKSDDNFDKLAAGKYAEDDYLIVYTKGADVDDKILAVSDVKTVSGKVSTFKNKDGDTYNGYNGYITLDGTKYTLASGYNEVEIKAGDEYNFFLDENGYVIGAETKKESEANIDEVYYVDNVWSKKSTVAGNKNVMTYFAQLVAMDGTISVVELEDLDKNVDSNKTTTYETNYDGKLVTISDKKWTDGNNDTHKANDKKVDLKLWTPNTEKTWDLYTASAFAKNLEKDATRIGATVTAPTSGSKTFRLNSATKYIFVENTQDKLDSKVYTGGVAFDKAKVTSAYVITGDDSLVAKYVIIKTNNADQSQTYSKDAIFIKSNSTEMGDGYRAQTVYYADGTKKTISVDDSEYGTLHGFYTYDTNDDGYYVLDDANTMTIEKNFVWDDEEGAIVDATIGKDALFQGLLTVTAKSTKSGESSTTYSVEDIDVSAAAFVDAHSTDGNGQYDKSVSTLSRLATLVNDEKVGAVTLSLNVSKDGAVIIVVTSIAAK